SVRDFVSRRFSIRRSRAARRSSAFRRSMIRCSVLTTSKWRALRAIAIPLSLLTEAQWQESCRANGPVSATSRGTAFWRWRNKWVFHFESRAVTQRGDDARSRFSIPTFDRGALTDRLFQRASSRGEHRILARRNQAVGPAEAGDRPLGVLPYREA